jgi:hypothetical protein
LLGIFACPPHLSAAYRPCGALERAAHGQDKPESVGRSVFQSVEVGSIQFGLVVCAFFIPVAIDVVL